METLGLKYRERYGKNRNAQSFDKDNIFTEKAGIKFNNYEAIQAAREDTEIYPTLEKYNSIEQASNIMNRGTPELEGYGTDIRGITNLRDIFELQNKADKLWLNLPLDVREAFGHSKETMCKDGVNILNNIIKKKQEEHEKLVKQEEEKTGVTKDE